jgi:hypothetical protein
MKNKPSLNLTHCIKQFNRYVRKYTKLKAIKGQFEKIELLKKRISKLRSILKSFLKPQTIALSAFMFVGSALSAQNYNSAVSLPYGMGVFPGSYTTPAFVDIDNDGDLDVILGESGGNFAWYENTGTATSPAFGAVAGNPFGLAGSYTYSYSSPTFTDLDNDGDMDMISGSSTGDLLYYQNTGTASAPAFAAYTINPFSISNAGSYVYPAFVNLDNDGDMDIMAGLSDGSFIYYQNIGTASAPNFTSPTSNPFGLSVGSYIYNTQPAFIDLDHDGDMDMLVGDSYGDFLYFTNTGTISAPAFGGAGINPFNLTNVGAYASPAFSDLDGDGDIDLLSGNQPGDMIYFEDTTHCIAPGVGTTLAGVTITATTTGAGITYQWLVCPGMAIAPGASTNQTYTATANGNYAVVVSNPGCSDTSACVTVNSVGIAEWMDEHEISVYPNPNNGSFTIKGSKESNLILQNEVGQIVQHFALNASNNYRFSMDNLSNGIYFIATGNNKVLKVVVAK